MKSFYFLLFLSASFYCSAFANDEKNTVAANLKTVTIYRTGAEMTHTATATLSKSNNELIIEGISSYVDVNSIQVKCPAAVTILGVEFSNNYLVPENISAPLKKIRDSAEKLNADVEKINISITTTTDLIAVLKSNREIKGSQTGLSVAELMKLMDYYKTKSNELQIELSALNSRKNKLKALVDKLDNQAVEEEKRT